MSKFLDSFQEVVTIDSDATHKSIDHVSGTVEKEATLTRFSTLTRSALSPQSVADFDAFQRDGFVNMEDLMSPEDLRQLQADTRVILDKSALGDNTFYGKNTRRAYSLLAQTRALDSLLSSPRLNTLVDSLFAPNALLSALQLIEILPGEQRQQLHYDQQFQNTFPSRDPFSSDPFVINFMLAVDDFTEENGATIILPGSHLWPVGRVPSPEDRVHKLVMKAGTICCFSGLLWHAGGANESEKARRGIVAVYLQPWLRTLENHFLSIPFKQALELSPTVQARLGYSIHHPFTGSVDFQHPMKKLKQLASL